MLLRVSQAFPEILYHKDLAKFYSRPCDNCQNYVKTLDTNLAPKGAYYCWTHLALYLKFYAYNELKIEMKPLVFFFPCCHDWIPLCSLHLSTPSLPPSPCLFSPSIPSLSQTIIKPRHHRFGTNELVDSGDTLKYFHVILPWNSSFFFSCHIDHFCVPVILHRAWFIGG